MVIVISALLLTTPAYTAKADSSILTGPTTYLYGNVIFNHKDLEIRAERGVITKDKVIARDSVIILEDDLIIFGNYGEYFWNKEVKLYNGFTACKGKESVTGDEGRYFEDKVWVYKAMKYTNEEEKISISGDEGFYDFNINYGMVTKAPKFEAPEDSIEIVGDTIRFWGDTLAIADRNAVLRLKDTQCFAEQMIYFPKKDEAALYGNPWIIANTDSLGGQEIEIALQDRKIKHIQVRGEVWGTRWKF